LKSETRLRGLGLSKIVVSGRTVNVANGSFTSEVFPEIEHNLIVIKWVVEAMCPCLEDLDVEVRDVVRVTGKGRNGGKPRDLHKHPDTDGVLRDYLGHRASVVRRAQRRDPSVEVPDALMLCWHTGRLSGMRATALDRRKDRMVALSGVRFGHHTLRRTWGRELWKAGVPVETISEMMGHSETKTTLRYLGINFDDQGEALNLLYARQQQARGRTLTKTLTSPELHQNA
jgi:site-specific recombinase XerD